MPLRLEVVDSMSKVDRAAWDGCVDEEDPFCEHAFLAAMETSGSVGARETGWIPAHLLCLDGDALVGAMPLYEKYDSYGEFIFDFGWADAARRARIAYFPKMVSAVPFTPAGSGRILSAPGADRASVLGALGLGARDRAAERGASSVHALFCTEEEQALLTSLDYAPRLSFQYHFDNRAGLRDFPDYLDAMRAPTRKMVRKERERARASGLTLSMREGRELGDAEWRALERFYVDTVDRKGGSTYLTPAFFARIRETFSSRVVASFAHRGAEPVAGALFFWKGSSLYGRYWGADELLDAMHFELCYYLPFEWGLARGMRRFEAGAQGEHKIKRGLLPNACFSAHWMRDQRLAMAVRMHVLEEAAHVRALMEAIGDHSPFREAV